MLNRRRFQLIAATTIALVLPLVAHAQGKNPSNSVMQKAVNDPKSCLS